ncbi:MAG: RNA polymerase sigma factor [Planctomycetaceae bacterium]
MSVWYAEHAASVLAFLKARLNREDAYDVSQTVWCKVQQHLPKFDGRHVRGWLFEIARNELINHKRKNKRRPQTLNDEDAACDPAAEELEMADRLDDHKRALRDCLKRLDPQFREAVQARLAGHSYAEISEQTQTPQNTLMTRHRRATSQLRECVERTLS